MFVRRSPDEFVHIALDVGDLLDFGVYNAAVPAPTLLVGDDAGENDPRSVSSLGEHPFENA